MFHHGDLQSGIAVAVQQVKAVFCFVHDDSGKSQEWENTIVNDEQLVEAIQRTAVALRIAAGSQEARYLSSFCPIIDVPTLVIIQQGATKEVISPKSTATDQLKPQITASLAQPPDDAGERSTRHADATNLDAERASAGCSGNASSSGASPEAHRSPLNPESSDATRTLPSNAWEHGLEHGARTQPNRESHAAEVAEGQELGSGDDSQVGTGPESSDVSASPVAKSIPQQDWLKKQREREEGQRKERARIKAQIQQDREERRRRAQARNQPVVDLAGKASENSAEASPSQPAATEVRVQVRTFDGSSIRSKFPRTATISVQIRPWIDDSIEQTSPYNLKIILGPQRNWTIEPAEEEQSLADLDLLGSCTLVMVPVKGYVDSYSPSGPGIITSVLSRGYNLLSNSAAAVFNGVGSLLAGSTRASSTPHEPSGQGEQPGGPSSGTARFRTLADQRMEAQNKDPRFYNGNQLDFEPRKDDAEADKE